MSNRQKWKSQWNNVEAKLWHTYKHNNGIVIDTIIMYIVHYRAYSSVERSWCEIMQGCPLSQGRLCKEYEVDSPALLLLVFLSYSIRKILLEWLATERFIHFSLWESKRISSCLLNVIATGNSFLGSGTSDECPTQGKTEFYPGLFV